MTVDGIPQSEMLMQELRGELEADLLPHKFNPMIILILIQIIIEVIKLCRNRDSSPDDMLAHLWGESIWFRWLVRRRLHRQRVEEKFGIEAWGVDEGRLLDSIASVGRRSSATRLGAFIDNCVV